MSLARLLTGTLIARHAGIEPTCRRGDLVEVTEERKDVLATETAAADAPAKRTRAVKAPEAPLPFERKLWLAADKLRGQLEEGDYKHVVLGLIFLKYVSDAFAHRRTQIAADVADPTGEFFLTKESQRLAALEDRDFYTMANVAWVPADARWEILQANAKQADIGMRIDGAMDRIEQENPPLRGVLPRAYGRPEIKARLLGELIDLFSGIGFHSTEAASSEDILGRVYEYFLNQFGANEGGQYYTPQQVVRLLVEMLQPYRGRVFDPACGSGGMFVQSAKFVEGHGGTVGDIHVFGQEAVAATWRIAKMNLAIRHIDADLGAANGDSFHEDLHPDLRADFVLANPPFNQSDWGGHLLRDDKRWVYGAPPVGNANFAWAQNFLHHLAPTGTTGFVLANGALSVQGQEGEIRRKFVEAGIVDCIVSLPSKLFFGTTIPVSLWFLAKDRSSGPRDRRGETLFIDARSLGQMVSRTQRILSTEDVDLIAGAYRAWRGRDKVGYKDRSRFCASATTDAIASNGYVLAPSRYAGSTDGLDDGADGEIDGLIEALITRIAESDEAGARVREALSLLEPDNAAG
jgi:type I restriction enzyme M protein